MVYIHTMFMYQNISNFVISSCKSIKARVCFRDIIFKFTKKGKGTQIRFTVSLFGNVWSSMEKNMSGALCLLYPDH